MEPNRQKRMERRTRRRRKRECRERDERMKGWEGGQGRKPNKLSGCNNVLSPDKLLANTAALRASPARRPGPLFWWRSPSCNRPSWQRSTFSLGPISSPDIQSGMMWSCVGVCLGECTRVFVGYYAKSPFAGEKKVTVCVCVCVW